LCDWAGQIYGAIGALDAVGLDHPHRRHLPAGV
jgi:hypothetical protein